MSVCVCKSTELGSDDKPINMWFIVSSPAPAVAPSCPMRRTDVDIRVCGEVCVSVSMCCGDGSSTNSVSVFYGRENTFVSNVHVLGDPCCNYNFKNNIISKIV